MLGDIYYLNCMYVPVSDALYHSYFHVTCNEGFMYLVIRLIWWTHIIFIRVIVIPSRVLCIGWPLCKTSGLTLIDASQHAFSSYQAFSFPMIVHHVGFLQPGVNDLIFIDVQFNSIWVWVWSCLSLSVIFHHAPTGSDLSKVHVLFATPPHRLCHPIPKESSIICGVYAPMSVM